MFELSIIVLLIFNLLLHFAFALFKPVLNPAYIKSEMDKANKRRSSLHKDICARLDKLEANITYPF